MILAAAPMDAEQSSKMLRPATRTASDTSFRRAPLQAPQGISRMYPSMRLRDQSLSVSAWRRRRNGMTPS